MKQFLQARWQAFSRTPFGCLLRLCVTRMFHGGGEPGADELDLSIGVILIMLAMPGILVSLLMFEKYGSLIRYLRGNLIFDPYTATVPDEYFFIVLSPNARERRLHQPGSSSRFAPRHFLCQLIRHLGASRSLHHRRKRCFPHPLSDCSGRLAKFVCGLGPLRSRPRRCRFHR